MRAIALLLLPMACVSNEATNPFGAGLLQDKPAMALGGEAWPVLPADEWQPPTPLRTFYVAIDGDDEAVGGAETPWRDLQTSLCRLRPGDRLVLRGGTYSGPVAIDGDCVDADGRGPIEVVGEAGAIIASGPSPSDGAGFWQPIVLVNRAGWSLRGLIIDGSAQGGIGLQVLGSGDRSTLRDLVIKETTFAGLSVGPNVNGLDGHNLVLRHGRSHEGNKTHGLLVLGGCTDIKLRRSFIHHNSGDGIQLWGSHMVPTDLGSIEPLVPTSGLIIDGNEIHDNHGHGLVIGFSQGTEVRNNTLWNGRPSTVGEGRAIEIHDGAVSVSVEGNLIVESTEGIAVTAGERTEALPAGARPPRDVLIMRNLIRNPLQPGRYGILVDTATDVRIYHNAIEGVRKGLFIKDLPPKTAALRALNNLVFEASELGFRMSGMAAFDRFDYNAFGLGSTAVLGEINGERASVATFIEDGTIANSQAVGLASVTSDLMVVDGLEVVDVGVPIPGLPYEGEAPDLGPAEHP